MNVPESTYKIQQEEIAEGMPISESLLQKMGGALNYIQNRLQRLAVGSIEGSFLTEAQYQAISGVGFILSDGRDVSGNAYATIKEENNVPNLCGMMLRMRDFSSHVSPNSSGTNPDGVLDLGTYQDALVGSHTHDIGYHDPTYGYIVKLPMNLAFSAGTGEAGGYGEWVPADIVFTVSAQGTPSGRPKNVVTNWFIRIN